MLRIMNTVWLAALLVRHGISKNPFALSLSKCVRILVLRQSQHERPSGLIRAGSIMVLAGALAFSFSAKAERGLSVAVIAHSIETRTAAHEALKHLGWTESKDLGQSDAVVVACRSSLNWPLNNTYNSIKELDSDAKSLLNIDGSDYHIYVYKINNDMSVDEIKYISYPAKDGDVSQLWY